MTKKNNKMKNYLFLFVFLYPIFLVTLAKYTSIEFDETTHSLLAVFYKDLIKYSISHPNFKEIYDYAYSYLVYYPKLSVYYPPLTHLIISLFFGVFGSSFLIAKCVIIIFSLAFIFLVFEFSKFVLKDEKAALVSALLFSSSPITIYLSRGVYLDLPLAFFFTLSLFLYLLALEKKKNKYYLLAGLITGVCFLVKWFAIFIYPIVLVYAFLEKKGEIKKIISSFLISGVIILSYVLITLKLGVFLLVFTSDKGTLIPATKTIPQANTINGWLVYANLINQYFFVFPVSILLFYSFWKYFKNKEGYWKFLILWVALSYIFLTLIPNKDHRFFFLSIFPLCVILSKEITKWKIKDYIKYCIIAVVLLVNFSMYFNLYEAKSLYGKPTPTFKTYKTYGKEISDFILSNPSPTYFASETYEALPSETMFYLASQGKFIKILRPCAKNNDLNKTLYEAGVEWIVYDTRDENNSNINELKEKNLITLEKSIDGIEIYRYKFFNTNPDENCNIVCLTEEKICEKIKLHSS